MLSLRVVQFSLFAIFISLMVFISHQARAENWDLHEASLKTSYQKIRGTEKKIYELVQKKRQVKSREEVEPLLEEIKKEHKSLSEMIDNLEKERNHVRFEHPEQGDKSERKYYPYKLKSLEDFEREGGLDGRLNKVKIKMLEQYGDPIPSKAKNCDCDSNGNPRQPASVPDEQPERIKLSF